VYIFNIINIEDGDFVKSTNRLPLKTSTKLKRVQPLSYSGITPERFTVAAKRATAAFTSGVSKAVLKAD
jgi:hypothetical protein